MSHPATEICVLRQNQLPNALVFLPFGCEMRASTSSKVWQTVPVQRAQHHISTYVIPCRWQQGQGSAAEGPHGTLVLIEEPGWHVCCPQVLYKRESSCWAMCLEVPTLRQFSWVPSEPCERQTDCLSLALWLGNGRTCLLQKLCRTGYVH